MQSTALALRLKVRGRLRAAQPHIGSFNRL